MTRTDWVEPRAVGYEGLRGGADGEGMARLGRRWEGRSRGMMADRLSLRTTFRQNTSRSLPPMNR